ncbi:GNAT family N-acetyltransferase [Micromonospora echinofusca]|uniref:GNAT family N-acetyltransferase n=1 Tax=Micromonospora echinofusca TaxID=47858 RepID=A0ABS3VQ76_MICEH|nr:GNAT family N-acetyltransferase [Micromonospora echinofusca]MBO4206636.1 GNAT family N-acetyltransferase [Micromonospora echinofusca]
MLTIGPLDVRHDDAVAHRVLQLQRAAYAVEATLIGSDGIPALHETVDGLRTAPERWLGAHDTDGLAGAVAYNRPDDATLDICKLVVAPRAFRRGVATALLDALDAAEPAGRTVVSTGAANTPALRLYQRRGFVAVREVEVAPGLRITHLVRPGPAAHDRPPTR